MSSSQPTLTWVGGGAWGGLRYTVYSIVMALSVCLGGVLLLSNILHCLSFTFAFFIYFCFSPIHLLSFIYSLFVLVLLSPTLKLSLLIPCQSWQSFLGGTGWVSLFWVSNFPHKLKTTEPHFNSYPLDKKQKQKKTKDLLTNLFIPPPDYNENRTNIYFLPLPINPHPSNNYLKLVQWIKQQQMSKEILPPHFAIKQINQKQTKSCFFIIWKHNGDVITQVVYRLCLKLKK